MTTRTWKRFLVGATAAAALSVPGIALADPTCVFVLGQVDSVTVATPAVIVLVPDSEAGVQPVRVHLDEQEQTILGYSVRTPGVDEGVNPPAVFVPGTEATVNPIVASTLELPIETGRCEHVGVSTPAIPVYVPESSISTPGVTVPVPAIELNILGHPVTTVGHAIVLEEKSIVIPAYDNGVPAVSVTTPDKTIVVSFSTNGLIESARHLVPPNP